MLQKRDCIAQLGYLRARRPKVEIADGIKKRLVAAAIYDLYFRPDRAVKA